MLTPFLTVVSSRTDETGREYVRTIGHQVHRQRRPAELAEAAAESN
jgi:hypothetical protein